ncbi:MAG: lysozyme [Novosphingobium sp.]
MLNRKPIFDEVRLLLGRGFTESEVSRLDAALDRALGLAPPVADRHHLGSAGNALIRQWEGCGKRRADGCLEAYPDPGSANGKPWTIGWGSTGPDIGPGTVWTQDQCDTRFDRDIVRYVRAVNKALGDAPTTQNQFDALVSFHYNTGAIATATLTKLHKERRYAEALVEFKKWIYNDGQILAGLEERRTAEAELYGKK